MGEGNTNNHTFCNLQKILNQNIYNTNIEPFKHLRVFRSKTIKLFQFLWHIYEQKTNKKIFKQRCFWWNTINSYKSCFFTYICFFFFIYFFFSFISFASLFIFHSSHHHIFKVDTFYLLKEKTAQNI